MTTTITLRDGMKTTIQSGSHTYHADEPIDDGGTDTAPSPTQMLMGALGSCMAMTVKMYADRKGWDLQGVDVALDYERFKASEYEAYEGDALFVHEIREAMTFHGDLDEKQRERLLEIAGKCPVRRVVSLPTFWKEELLEAK